MSIEARTDEAPGNPDPGWHMHPQHPTVERYWDGEAWTSEHRFAQPVPGDDERRDASPEDDTAPSARDLSPAVSGSLWLAGAFGLPIVYMGGAQLVLNSPDDCATDADLNWLFGVGIVMCLVTAAAAERGMRLLDARLWVRAVVAAVSALFSGYLAYSALLAVVLLSAVCSGC